MTNSFFRFETLAVTTLLLASCSGSSDEAQLVNHNPGEAVTLNCAPAFAEDISTCNHASTDYEPRQNSSASDTWDACAPDAYYSDFNFPLVVGPSAPGGGIGRVNAWEDMAVKLWRSGKVPTKTDFEDALVILNQGDGSINSRLVRRQDIHYPDIENNSKTKCTEPGVTEANPDRCVGPGKLVPVVNAAFEAAINNGTDPLSQSARIEAALAWFFYASVLAEQFTCLDTAEDCDSVWSHYNAALAQNDADQKGLARYFKSLSEETHARTFDGVLAISCWRHLDNGASVSVSENYNRSQAQTDTAMLRGMFLMLRDRFVNFGCSPGGDIQNAHLAFINVLGPLLDRSAQSINAGLADTLKTQVAKTDATQVDASAAIAAIDGLFPCP